MQKHKRRKVSTGCNVSFGQTSFVVDADEHFHVGHWDVVGLVHRDDGVLALFGNLLATGHTSGSCHVSALGFNPHGIAVCTDGEMVVFSHGVSFLWQWHGTHPQQEPSSMQWTAGQLGSWAVDGTGYDVWT